MKLYSNQEEQEQSNMSPSKLYQLCEEFKITCNDMLKMRHSYRKDNFEDSYHEVAKVIQGEEYLQKEAEKALGYFFYEPTEHLFAFELIQVLKRDFEVSKYDDMEDYLAYVIGGLQGRSGMLIVEMGGIENCQLLN